MSEVRIVNVQSCEPGMVIANDIMNEYGAVILYKNSKLDEYAINKLKRMDIEYVKVFREYAIEENKVAVNEALYNNSLSDFKDIVWNISCGKNIELSRVQEVVTSLSSNFNSINDVVSSLSKIRAVDEYTFCHGLNVSLLSTLLGKWLNLHSSQIKLLAQAGLLHDIGKTKISPAILNKPGLLTPEEYEEMKKHPILGYNILEKTQGVSKDIAMAVLMHHEREDGSGYPFGATSSKIHYNAKIISVVDVFDAMTSNRVYKKRQPPFDVLELYESEYLTKCDAGILMTFLKRISSYYIGNFVKLSNGDKGEIVYINQNRISRPIIRLKDSDIIDLSYRPDLKVVELL
ncbi:MAG: HD-GYP domain-containing protein [Bacillota bacterium]